MADYSGYYECGECGASGTYSAPAHHKLCCSVPETVARLTHEDAVRKQQEKERLAAIYQEWYDLPEEELFQKLRRHTKLEEHYYDIYRELRESHDQALDVLRSRNLTSKWINRFIRGSNDSS